MRKIILIVFIMGIFTGRATAQPVFLVPRIQEIAQKLELESLDTLKAGINENYSAYGHKLRIRVNEYGELDHIGIRLFPQEMRDAFDSPRAIDFLERYALELVMTPEKERFRKLAMDKVTFLEGNIETFINLTGTESFNFICHNQKKYRFAWYEPSDMDTPTLLIESDMDYQLITGCNEKELDRLFLMMMQRYNGDSEDEEIEISSDEEIYVHKGETYLRDYINNDLYYIRDGKDKGSWKLIDDFKKSPQAAMSNLFIKGGNKEDLHLIELTIDQYGYRSLTIHIPYRKLLNYCQSQGCEVYYRTRGKKADGYEASVFFVNNNYGYNHLIMIKTAEDEFSKSNVIIKGRMYCHIPMHNISENYFN